MRWTYVLCKALLVCLVVPQASAIISVGSAEVPGLALDVELVGDVAYVADFGFRASGLQIFDVSDPSLPVALGSLPERSVILARDVEVAGTFAYLADSQFGEASVRVVDVSDPRAPVEIATLLVEGQPVDLEIAGALAYVAAREGGLRVVDVSDPHRPFEVAALETIGDSSGLSVSGSFVYLADTIAFRVIDVANPSHPVEVGRVETPVFVRNVELVGNVAYALTDAGIQLIDVTDPAHPRTMTTIETPGRVDDVEFVGDIAYSIVGQEEVCLTGETREGRTFEGCDAIETLPVCGQGFEVALAIPGVLLLRRSRYARGQVVRT